jgi:hypothetical protein
MSATKDPIPAILELLELYRGPGANAADLLCERHDPSAVAFVSVASDLSSRRLAYGELTEKSRRFANRTRRASDSPRVCGLGPAHHRESHAKRRNNPPRWRYPNGASVISNFSSTQTQGGR